jgi:NAD(P)-dependent dehydrogenase (short-subunit alcohol dehydrogenase family)
VHLVQDHLGDDAYLYAVVSNAGILWGYTLEEQFAVNAIGACRVMDNFLPLLDPKTGRLVVVSSGLGPLMHGYADEKRQETLQSPTLTFDGITQIMEDCLKDESAEGLASAGFPGGPFAEAVPDFHKYGIAKCLADAYQSSLAKKHKNLRIYSCDPGLVYTDLILKMPKYEGQEREETGAKTPEEGVEAAMRLIFTDEGTSGMFHAMNKAQTKLLTSEIYNKPTE